jgi:hypothetical protein
MPVPQPCLTELNVPETINHRSSARTSVSNSVGPFSNTGFVFNKSRMRRLATNRNPSIQSFNSCEAAFMGPLPNYRRIIITPLLKL